MSRDWMRAARNAIADPRNDVFVSAVTGWEISVKRARGRITAPSNLSVMIEERGFIHLLAFHHAELSRCTIGMIGFWLPRPRPRDSSWSPEMPSSPSTASGRCLHRPAPAAMPVPVPPMDDPAAID